MYIGKLPVLQRIYCEELTLSCLRASSSDTAQKLLLKLPFLIYRYDSRLSLNLSVGIELLAFSIVAASVSCISFACHVQTLNRTTSLS